MLVYILPVLQFEEPRGGGCLCQAQVQQVLPVLATQRPLVAMAFGRPTYAGCLTLPRALLAVSKTAFEVTTCRMAPAPCTPSAEDLLSIGMLCMAHKAALCAACCREGGIQGSRYSSGAASVCPRQTSYLRCMTSRLANQ